MRKLKRSSCSLLYVEQAFTCRNEMLNLETADTHVIQNNGVTLRELRKRTVGADWLRGGQFIL